MQPRLRLDLSIHILYLVIWQSLTLNSSISQTCAVSQFEVWMQCSTAFIELAKNTRWYHQGIHSLYWFIIEIDRRYSKKLLMHSCQCRFWRSAQSQPWILFHLNWLDNLFSQALNFTCAISAIMPFVYNRLVFSFCRVTSCHLLEDGAVKINCMLCSDPTSNIYFS